MKQVAAIFIAFACCASAHSQSFKKYPVSNSGCFFYGFCESKFDESYSEDSSRVYAGECTKEGLTYGVICVKLMQSVDDMTMAEDLMISYIDYLKVNFEIVKSAGYGRGHHLSGHEETIGVIDYWEDKDKKNWKIKSWTDGKYIGFMYVYGNKEIPEIKVNVFLEGFRFPGM